MGGGERLPTHTRPRAHIRPRTRAQGAWGQRLSRMSGKDDGTYNGLAIEACEGLPTSHTDAHPLVA